MYSGNTHFSNKESAHSVVAIVLDTRTALRCFSRRSVRLKTANRPHGATQRSQRLWNEQSRFVAVSCLLKAAKRPGEPDFIGGLTRVGHQNTACVVGERQPRTRERAQQIPRELHSSGLNQGWLTAAEQRYLGMQQGRHDVATAESVRHVVLGTLDNMPESPTQTRMML